MKYETLVEMGERREIVAWVLPTELVTKHYDGDAPDGFVETTQHGSPVRSFAPNTACVYVKWSEWAVRYLQKQRDGRCRFCCGCDAVPCPHQVAKCDQCLTFDKDHCIRVARIALRVAAEYIAAEEAALGHAIKSGVVVRRALEILPADPGESTDAATVWSYHQSMRFKE